MQDVAARLATRVQLTTDGLKAYLDAVEGAFGAEIDTPSSSSSMVTRRVLRAATARPNAPEFAKSASRATRRRRM